VYYKSADARWQSIEAFVEDSSALDNYTLILLVGPTKDATLLHKIVEYAQRVATPLFYIHCVGFYSHFSVQLPTHFPIVDTHPDPASTLDLRLLHPWPELQAYQKEKTGNLNALSDHDHGHIPYLLLLLHYLEVWTSSHDGQPPANYTKKKEFKALVESGARKNNAEGGEENYDEAAAAVLKSLGSPSISSGLREVFDSPFCKDLKPDSKTFWIVAHAIGQFSKQHEGLLPLPGALPDMKAQSSDYIQLQNIYKAKARADLAEISAIIRETASGQVVDEKEIEAFCKGAQYVKLIKGRPIRVASSTADDDIDWSDREQRLSQEASDPTSLLPIYFAFLALDRHEDELSRIRGLRKGTDPLKDIPGGHRAPSGAVLPLPNFAESAHFYTPKGTGGQAARFDTPEAREMFENVVKELDRADGAELHNIAALTGGMVAQEVIKVITKQYVPVDNTCVFDGIQSKTAVFNI
jgi:amyloid beta precursor protein binding protein 1